MTSTSVATAPATPPASRIHGATNHTVTIETLTAEQLTAAGWISHNTRRAVIETYNGQRIVIFVEGDAFIPATPEEVAADFASYHGATYIPPAATACDYCASTQCTDRFEHARWYADRDPREPRLRTAA